jgi:DNA repair protein RecN (Recombination protein N)
MIKRLDIQNYALIEALELSPSPSLNIITGETGAGKSILLGAIGLLLGNRSDSKAILDDRSKCIIEAEFDLSKLRLQPFFEQNEVDYTSECIIRRELSPGGKSRSFVNDSPVLLTFLKELGDRLIDIHSQHESLQLNKKRYQLDVVDAFARHPMLISEYQNVYKKFILAQRDYDLLNQTAKEKSEDQDYKQFLLKELEEAELDNVNLSELEEELKLIENSEEIKLKLSQVGQLLNGEDFSTLNQLSEIRQQLSGVQSFSKNLEDIAERIESTRLELTDISNEIAQTLDQVEINPERAQELRERIDLIFRLQRKHQVLDVSGLIEIRDSLSQELQSVANLDEKIAEAEKELTLQKEQVGNIGQKLTESRKLASLDLSTEIEKVIRKIGIENGRVDININTIPPSPTGLDEIEILFSANKGVKPEDLSQVASGGEFSRLIFAIKYLVADRQAMPTVVFDEIDTGVSGEVAIQMAGMMKEMSEKHQVIAISHLPQFAATGDAHYFVFKDHSSDRSISKIRKLESEDRVEEIAKMIGGKQPTNSAFSSARELLGIN